MNSPEFGSILDNKNREELRAKIANIRCRAQQLGF
jgi:hypothetical protein